jgi:methylamine dehydrogenase accessory protein MauD
MTNLLIASNIILWIAVILMAIVIFALIRQVGILYERVAPAGALAINKQLSVGQAAPQLDVLDFNSKQTLAIGGQSSNQHCQLLFFVSPTCPMCKSLIGVAKSIAKAEQNWIDLVFASDGEDSKINQFIETQKLTNSHFINSELLGKTYGVSKLPYAVLIDEKGTLQAMGIVNSREHIESLFNVKETGYSSLQEYMQKNYA